MDYQYHIADPVVSFIEGWKKNNLISDSISIKNFEHNLVFDFNEASIVHGQRFVPAGKTSAGISDSFHVYRYLTYKPENWKESIAIVYYLVPGKYTFRSVQQLVQDHSHSVANIRLYRSLINDPVAENNLAHYSGTKLSVKKSPENIQRDAPLDEGCEWVEIEWYWQTWVNGVLVSEAYLFSTSEVLCESTGGGGSGGDTTIVLTNNPFDSVVKYANNAEFKAKLDSIKAKTSGNHEGAYKFTYDGSGQINETYSQGTAGTLAVNYEMAVSEKIDGLMHNHFFVEGKSVSIFSISDIHDLINLYKDGNIKNMYTFSITLASQSGNQYMLTINNLQDFSDFAQKNQLIDDLTNAMNLYPSKPDRAGENYSEHNELNFIKFLQTFKTGLKFFRKNATSDQWDPLKQSGGQIVADPCP